MKFYRKIPVIVKAEQWFDGAEIEGVEYPQPQFSGGKEIIGRPFIRTLEGDMFISPGDYIITGTAGEKYPCKESIFVQIYEPIGDVF